jgi:hypothetical protein
MVNQNPEVARQAAEWQEAGFLVQVTEITTPSNDPQSRSSS